MPPSSSSGPDAPADDVWRRNARRNLVAVAAVAVLVGGAAVAMAATTDGDDDGDGVARSLSLADADTSPDGSAASSSEPATTATPGSSTPMSSTPDASLDGSSVPEPSIDASTSSQSSTSSTTTTIDPADVAHAFPIDPAVDSSYTPQAHANYQATDIFAGGGCGTTLLAPVTGVVDEVISNVYDPAVDDPATRGGNAVSIVGDDGVRYYLAHFQTVVPEVVVGARVIAGDPLGEMGDTGRAGACHVHFGLSLPCENDEWWVRRGVIWPDEYLDSWRRGENLSPLPELQAWFAEYPDACASIEGTPYPVG